MLPQQPSRADAERCAGMWYSCIDGKKKITEEFAALTCSMTEWRGSSWLLHPSSTSVVTTTAQMCPGMLTCAVRDNSLSSL